jgi:hypothetical protein
VQVTRNKTQARRELAKTYLQEAARDDLSWHSRSEAGFDAAYLLALVLLGEEQAEGYEHPDPAALVAVATELGWSTAAVEAAIFQIEHRYDPAYQTQWYRPDGEPYTASQIRKNSPFAALMALAQRLQAADDSAQRKRDATPRNLTVVYTATVAEPFIPLESVNRPTVTTDEAAYYLNRKAQTLRIWACRENGPTRPLRIYGRLAWSVSDIRRLLGVAAIPKKQISD